jgi:hypothetical protein
MDAAGEAFGGLYALGSHGDVGAFLRQANCQSPTDAAAGSGDHRHTAAQIWMQYGVVHALLQEKLPK